MANLIKHCVTTILSMLLVVFAVAQSKGSGRLYAYRQPVLPGVSQGSIDVDGNTGSGSSPRKNYIIYLETRGRAFPSELWIEGERYGASVSTIRKTPVIRTTNGDSRVLVPKTSRSLVQLTPVGASENKSMAKAKSLAQSNQVVVVYKLNGKFYYQTKSELDEVDAAPMQ